MMKELQKIKKQKLYIITIKKLSSQLSTEWLIFKNVTKHIEFLVHNSIFQIAN